MHGHANIRVLEIERRSNRSHSVENSIWKKLWTRLKTTEWINVANLKFLGKYVMKICNKKFQENPTNVNRIEASGLADGKTDLKKLISFYRDYANRSNIKGVGLNLVGPL